MVTGAKTGWGRGVTITGLPSVQHQRTGGLDGQRAALKRLLARHGWVGHPFPAAPGLHLAPAPRQLRN